MKTVCPQGRMGSNPILSARFVEKQNELIIIIIQVIGEVPKRLKGLPWKGSRSLIAARGFKSLLLRSMGKGMYHMVCAFFLVRKPLFRLK